jgi:Ca2+-binding EF-hand superfamily protein
MLSEQGIDPSEEETARILSAVDRDGNGRVDREELGAFLATWLSSEPTYDDELALAFRALDKNGDGRLDAEELRDALRGREGGIADADAEQVLERIHVEKHGKIEWTEFAQAVEPQRRGWKRPWAGTAEGLRAVTDADVEEHERRKRDGPATG